VGTKKLGNKIILTGAVFYNQAVVSAFHKQLEGKTLSVAKHKEVSGAIGAALLAKEAMASQESKFRGFQKVVGSQCTLSTFTCKGCDNNCTITQMQMPNEKPTFYGSRCDRYDSTLSQARIETFFDQREKLLFQEYKEGSGTGPSVGIPRSLLVYDYAPLLLGFLNALNAKVVLSSKTNKEIIEQSIELSYTDSCFPLKLLHGHVAMLNDVDYILYPCAIRLGEKERDENQKYACPLVQASPFIVIQALGLEKRLLAPIIDFSRGNTETINNLAGVAMLLGAHAEQPDFAVGPHSAVPSSRIFPKTGRAAGRISTGFSWGADAGSGARRFAQPDQGSTCGRNRGRLQRGALCARGLSKGRP
jgi:hypothetical protein